MGIWALAVMDGAAHQLKEAGGEALLGARLRQNVIALNRAEFRIAAMPTQADLDAVKQIIAEEKRQIDERLSTLKSSAQPRQNEMLDRIEAEYRNYLTKLDNTLLGVEKVAGSIEISDAQKRIREDVLASKEAAVRLNDQVVQFVTFANDRNAEITAQASHTYTTSRLLLIAVSGAGIFVGTLLGFLISRYGIVVPLRTIVECLRRLANGDLATEIVGVGRKDEIGDIANTTQVFRDNLLRTKALEEEAQAAEERAAQARRQAMLDLADNLEGSVKSVVDIVSSAAVELQTTAQSMSATAEQTSQQATIVAAAAEQASGNVQTVAAASEELSGSISEIGRQVTEASNMIRAAVAEAERASGTMAGLSQAAQSIGEVVQLIQTIASQTNLLALNATIEAARAGDAGKGFAVVASEVKTLANQTARATEEIANQVAAIQASTKDAVGAIGSVGDSIGRVTEIAAAIVAAVEEQGAATQEIARNVNEAAQGTNEVSANIAGVTQAATDTGVGATQVLSASTDLSVQSDTLRVEVDKFLATVRAA